MIKHEKLTKLENMEKSLVEPHLFPVSIQLGPNVSIGTGVTIGAGVRVRESIILHGATLQVRHLKQFPGTNRKQYKCIVM